ADDLLRRRRSDHLDRVVAVRAAQGLAGGWGVGEGRPGEGWRRPFARPEGGLDGGFLARKAGPVLARVGPLASVAAELQLQRRHPPDRPRAPRARAPRQVVLDPRPLPRPPGGLVAVQRRDHALLFPLPRRQRVTVYAPRPGPAHGAPLSHLMRISLSRLTTVR